MRGLLGMLMVGCLAAGAAAVRPEPAQQVLAHSRVPWSTKLATVK